MVAREVSTKVLATGTNPAAGNEVSVTVGASGDGFVYHIKAIYIPVTVSTGATGMAIQIKTGSSVVWSGHTLTDVGVGTADVQAQRVRLGYTNGGGEVVVLPEKMIVPGGYTVTTLTDTPANADYGAAVVFGSKMKELR
jgi:hypothetical protein